MVSFTMPLDSLIALLHQAEAQHIQAIDAMKSSHFSRASPAVLLSDVIRSGILAAWSKVQRRASRQKPKANQRVRGYFIAILSKWAKVGGQKLCTKKVFAFRVLITDLDILNHLDLQ